MEKYWYDAIVKRVIDGDTIVVDIDKGFRDWSHNAEIRFLGINAPEKRGSTKEAGLVSKEYVENKILGKVIRINTVMNKDDSFGRWLAVVYYDDNGKLIDLNQELVNKGLAVIDKR